MVSLGLLVTIICGALATTFCALAANHALGRATEENPKRPLFAFWACVGAYMLMFTMLRVAYWFDWETSVWFYLQTVAGATTVVALSYIMIGVAFGHQWARLGAEVAAGAAVMTLTLVFALGLEGPRLDAVSIEYLPQSAVARWTIGAVYIVAPAIMAGLAIYATSKHHDLALRRQAVMFGAAVVLIFAPNAGKYVTFFEGPTSVALAVIMTCGVIMGWRAPQTT